jgi:hypothetical protein
MQDLNIRTRLQTPSEYKARLNARYKPPQISQGVQAARLYLANKQIERAIRIERGFLIAWACLAVAALATPFILFAGV